jgi:hypothetical protein
MDCGDEENYKNEETQNKNDRNINKPNPGFLDITNSILDYFKVNYYVCMYDNSILVENKEIQHKNTENIYWEKYELNPNDFRDGTFEYLKSKNIARNIQTAFFEQEEQRHGVDQYKIFAAIAENCPNLKSLSCGLGYNEITDACLIKIATKCNHLVVLNLDFCVRITDKGLIAIAKNCKNLKVLYLSDFENIQDNAIFAIANNCRFLTKLVLTKGDIWQENYFTPRVSASAIIAILKKCENLQELKLYKIDLTNHLVDALLKCKNLKYLTITVEDKVSDHIKKKLYKYIQDVVIYYD